MIYKSIADLASQMNIKLSQALVVDGRKLGCLNTHLLNHDADGYRVSTLVYQSEMDELQSGVSCKPLEDNISCCIVMFKDVTGILIQKSGCSDLFRIWGMLTCHY